MFVVGVLQMVFFFFNDTATTEIYTLSLHDALPISGQRARLRRGHERLRAGAEGPSGDRKSTRLNSSHQIISYAVFCLKKNKLFFLYCDDRRHGLLHVLTSVQHRAT